MASTFAVQDIANKDDILNTIKDITNEEYIHVGQLEKLLQLTNPAASNIDDGAVEAENDIAKVEVEDVK